MTIENSFNADTPAHSENGIFGFPFNRENALVCLVPVPFQATTSYLQGTNRAPEAILHASPQLDFYHPLSANAWQKGITLLPEHQDIQKLDARASALVQEMRESGHAKHEQINEMSEQLNRIVASEVSALLRDGKIVGTIGGDHATAYGAIKSHVEHYPDMGVLHFDAHDDLRLAYEGFHYSHASVMANIMQETSLKQLTSVGIRDYCEQEETTARQLQDAGRLSRFLAEDIFSRCFSGESWASVCQSIIDTLPQQVYVSFDIDGLDPTYCPSTGTPVPGGLSYPAAIYLLRQVIQSGKQLIGFDLVEVGPGEYDGNVGARLVYEMSILAILSR